MTQQPRNTKGRFRGASTAILDIRFNPGQDGLADLDPDEFLGNGTVDVEFQSRGTYRYYDVNYIDYVNFKDSPSWGSFFNENFRNNYTNFERIA